MAQEIFRLYGTIAIREDGDLDKRLDDIGEKSGGAGDAVSDLQDKFDELGGAAGGLAGILGAVFIAALKESIDFVDEFDGSLGELKASTDATNQEMQGFEDSLENLYRKGYGDSLTDISVAMGEVYKQTGLQNEELEKQVENTMTLSEKLDSDYGETIRTVDNLVRIFGITHDDAFDLIAKGYQENLNIGGDLLDLFNEYSTNLEKIGLDEQDMLNILVSGREQAIYDYDTLLDGVREYGTKVYELLQGEEDAIQLFKDLGLNINDVREAYIKGGEEAANMNQKVWDALMGLEDPIEQHRIGTELMGSIWEDTSGRVGNALTDIDGDVKNVKGSMDDLLETNTDEFTDNWEIAVRDWKLKSLKPMGEALVIARNEFFKFYNEANKATEEGFEKMTDSIGNFMDKFNKKLSEWKRKSIKKVGEWKDESIEEFNDTFNDIIGLIDDFISYFLDAKNDISSFTDSISDGFYNISDAVGNVIKKISNIKFPSVPSWIPGFADGVRNLRSPTMALVGEEGPELIYLPQGASVYSNRETNDILNNANDLQVGFGGGKTNNISIDKIIIDPKNIKDMTDFIDMITNFNDNMISYGGEV